MSGFYGADLARIHEEAYTQQVASAASSVVELLRVRGIDRGLVLDLGCGAGQLAEAVVNASYEAWRGYGSHRVGTGAAVFIARKPAPRRYSLGGR